MLRSHWLLMKQKRVSVVLPPKWDACCARLLLGKCCVSHLPQVAALGDCHFGVDKHVCEGKTITRFQALDRTGRIEELARMIGHECITETARRQACELLEGRGVLPPAEVV